jgi:hypothetical protein
VDASLRRRHSPRERAHARARRPRCLPRAVTEAHTAPERASPGIAQSIPAAVALTSQTITFNALSNRTFGNPPFTVTAAAASGLPVSFSSLTTAVCTVSGNTVTIVAAGTCTIRASQAGDATYAPAPSVDRTFTAAKASQTISFGTIASKTSRRRSSR